MSVLLMACSVVYVCQKWDKPPAGSRSGWTTRGITDWNHASELLKQHADSLWHRDAAATSAMAQQVERSGSVAREAAERMQRNRSIYNYAFESSLLSCETQLLTPPYINLCFSS